jgi:hypothetical protein
MAYQQINSVGHLYYCDVCNKTFAVKSHMVGQCLRSGECTVAVEWPVQRSLEGGTS